MQVLHYRHDSFANHAFGGNPARKQVNAPRGDLPVVLAGDQVHIGGQATIVREGPSTLAEA